MSDSEQPRVWFLDTSSLLSMAVHPGIEGAILEAIGPDLVVIVDVVVTEVAYRRTQPETASWATTASRWLAALSERPSWRVMPVLDMTTEEEINAAQIDIAERPVEVGSDLHRGEAAVVALVRQAHRRAAERGAELLRIVYLAEDFRARQVAACVPGVTAKSVTRVIRDLVRFSGLSPESAERTHAPLAECRRAPSVTAEEFGSTSLRPLGRAGQP